MGLFDKFFAVPQIADFIEPTREYELEIEDAPVYLPTGETVTVKAIADVYGDGERYYVVGGGWADWVTLENLF